MWEIPDSSAYSIIIFWNLLTDWSDKSFSNIQFIDAIPADAAIYYGRKKARDDEARKAYRSSKRSKDNINELFIIDIMREEIKNGDPRLQ